MTIPLRNGLRQTPLKRTASLKATHNLHTLSERKIAELNWEVEARKSLCYRAGGIPILRVSTVYLKGVPFKLTTVKCQGGTCECGCNRPANWLEPHEKVNRGRGGQLSLENTLMVTRQCHRRLQHSEPMWATEAGK